MDLLESIHSGALEGLSVLVYARPKTGKTHTLINMDWKRTLLLDFDTDGHITLTAKGINPTVISFALLNVAMLKKDMDAQFGVLSKPQWDSVCENLMLPAKTPRDTNSPYEFANSYRKEMIGEKHLPLFIDGDGLMDGKSKYLALDNLSRLVNSQIMDRYDTIVVDNISKLRDVMMESYIHWVGRSSTQNEWYAVNKRLKSFDSDLLNIKNSGKNLVVMSWAVNREVIVGKDNLGNPIKAYCTFPDVGGSWSESYAGNFSLCLEACREEFVTEGGQPTTVYYVSANNRTVASRVFPLIGDECFKIKNQDGTADRNQPYLFPDLNMIINSIKKVGTDGLA